MPDAAKTAVRAAKHRRLAIGDPVAVCLFVVLAAVGLAADLSSKHLVFKSLLGAPALNDKPLHDQPIAATAREALQQYQRPFLPGVKFTLSTNPGIVFGLPLPRRLVNVATLLTIALVLFFFMTSDAKARLAHLALAFILAGAAGNLYDRVLAKVTVPGFDPICYEVRDFIDCSAIYYPYIFNIADALLVIGAGVLAIYCGRGGLKAKAATQADGQ